MCGSAGGAGLPEKLRPGQPLPPPRNREAGSAAPGLLLRLDGVPMAHPGSLPPPCLSQDGAGRAGHRLRGLCGSWRRLPRCLDRADGRWGRSACEALTWKRLVN